MPTVKLSDMLEGLEFASFDGPYEAAAYVCRETGTVYCVADDESLNEDLPDDLDDSARYLPLPDKRELDLGRRLVFAFVEEAAPAEGEAVAAFFRQRGAYARFKDWLARRDLIARWHEFERVATEAALREWCAENGFEVVA